MWSPRRCPTPIAGEPGHHGQNRRPPRSELSISNRPDKLPGTHPLNWFIQQGSSSSPRLVSPRRSYLRLARLPNSGISPSTGFRQGPAPRFVSRAPTGPRPSTQVGEVPNSGGISPLNWFSLRDRRLSEVDPGAGSTGCQRQRLPNSGGISPLNWLSPRLNFQVGEVAQLRYLSINWFRYSRLSVAQLLRISPLKA